MPDVDKLTKSEELFETYCKSNNIQFERIPRNNNSKSPDYLMTVKNQDLIVEIKQVEPNEDDAKFRDSLLREGKAFREYDVKKSLKRVQRLIKDADRQIVEYQRYSANLPSIVILFDNTGCNHYTNNYCILTALCGLESISIQEVVPGQTFKPARGFGPRNHRLLQPNKTISVSCIGTFTFPLRELDVVPDLTLCLYHNPMAPLGIDPRLFAKTNVIQARLANKVDNEFQRWEVIVE